MRFVGTVVDCVRLVFGLVLLGALCLGWAPCAWVLNTLDRRRDGRIGRRVNHACIRFYLAALERIGAMRFDLSALDALEAEGVDDGRTIAPPVIIAPNHPRLLDAFLVVSRLSNVVCIMKKDIDDNVFLGQAARLAGYIGNDSTVQMVRDSVRTLKRGNHLLLFPEGTRTVCDPVNPLTAAVGLIAQRANVAVQTVFIECDSPYLRKGWPLFRRPSLPITYRVRLGRRFDPPADVRAFTGVLETYFIDELSAGRTPPASTPPVGAPTAPGAKTNAARDAMPASLTKPPAAIESHPT